MNATTPSPPTTTSAASTPAARHTPTPGAPIAETKFQLRAPHWLQVLIILALFGTAVYVALEGHFLWCTLLAIAGVAFGMSFILRRMVGDHYDRS